MIQEKIKTFEDACTSLNISSTLPEFSGVPENLVKSLTAHYKLCIITEALNEGWTPDWSNGEWKYFPYFYMNDSSSPGRFSFGDSGNLRSNSTVGSRLCFKSEELSDHAAEQFTDIYKDYFVIE